LRAKLYAAAVDLLGDKATNPAAAAPAGATPAAAPPAGTT